MRAVIQRVSKASVTIGCSKVAEIAQGLLVLLGVESRDTEADALWLAQKISQLRIFSDDAGKMNLSLLDVNGEIIVVSQFTLHARTKKGNRPSYVQSAKPEIAFELYQLVKQFLSQMIGKQVQSGEFGADMEVAMVNDGPVTIIMDSKNKE